MRPAVVELSPNRTLLDSNFDGYKLSLRDIPVKKRNFTKPIDRILLNSSQYSLLHTKLFGLQNHLIGDQFEENDSVYFVDSNWNICKTYVDCFTGDLIEPIIVWQVPKTKERSIGDYNVTFKFVDKNTAVLADGTGTMYIVDTGLRNNDDTFILLFSDNVIGSNEGFIIIDAVSKKALFENEELHVLLLNVKQFNQEERFTNLLHWISFKKDSNHWQQIAIKQLQIKGDLQYTALERDCNAIYVISDSGCQFITNSDSPVKIYSDIPKKYQWSQNLEEITITISFQNISNNPAKELVNLVSKSTEIELKYGHYILLKGQLYQRIDESLTTWSIENNCLEVVLHKSETGLMWPELVEGDPMGEYIVDTCIIEQIQERLTNRCSDTEAMPQCGSTFTSQPVEECDFEMDKNVTFERLCGLTNTVSHKIHLGSHQVLLTAILNTELASAFGVRHDVDICLWQPRGGANDFSVTHEGTLLAFGYVQASKQNRKFSVCPPDMSYSAICESSAHLFIYRQNRPISTSELRSRTTGRRIDTIAEQQVVNLSNEEVLGIYATNKLLFLLFESSMKVLKL